METGVFVYSASKNHPMVPVTRLNKALELVNNESTRLMIPDAESDVGGIKAAANFASWSDVKKFRIPLVNTPDFFLKGFNGYATSEEVVIDRNPYYAVVEAKEK